MEATPQRLFVGGLFDSVTDTDLRNRLTSFGDVKDVDIIQRKDDEGNLVKTFAYVNIDTTADKIKKCVSLYNKSKWYGKVIEVQLAKENYLSRLKREWESSHDVSPGKRSSPCVQPADYREKETELKKMKMAAPGLKIANDSNWVVGKYCRPLPVVHLRSKGRRVYKFDPSKHCHQLKKLDKHDNIVNEDFGGLLWSLNNETCFHETSHKIQGSGEVMSKKKNAVKQAGKLSTSASEIPTKQYSDNEIDSSDSSRDYSDGGISDELEERKAIKPDQAMANCKMYEVVSLKPSKGTTKKLSPREKLDKNSVDSQTSEGVAISKPSLSLSKSIVSQVKGMKNCMCDGPECEIFCSKLISDRQNRQFPASAGQSSDSDSRREKYSSSESSDDEDVVLESELSDSESEPSAESGSDIDFSDWRTVNREILDKGGRSRAKSNERGSNSVLLDRKRSNSAVLDESGRNSEILDERGRNSETSNSGSSDGEMSVEGENDSGLLIKRFSDSEAVDKRVNNLMQNRSQSDSNSTEENKNVGHRLSAKNYTTLSQENTDDRGISSTQKDGVNRKQKVSEEKRMASLASRMQKSKEQSNVVKLALSNLDNPQMKGSRITFESSEEENEGNLMDGKDTESAGGEDNLKNRQKVAGSSALSWLGLQSSDDSDENEDDRFQIKPQFEGPMGKELFKLNQQKGLDDRFKIDARFLEDDEEYGLTKSNLPDDFAENQTFDDEEHELAEEKSRTLSILDDLLGKPKLISKTSKPAEIINDVVRYDPLDEKHSRYKITQKQSDIEVDEIPEKPAEKPVDNTEDPETLAKTFFAVDSSLKNLFGTASSSSFTFLGSNDGDKQKTVSKNLDDQAQDITNKFAKHLSMEDDARFEELTGEETMATVHEKGNNDIEKFFFSFNDPRLGNTVPDGPKAFSRTESLENLSNALNSNRERLRQDYKKKNKDSLRRLKKLDSNRSKKPTSNFHAKSYHA